MTEKSEDLQPLHMSLNGISGLTGEGLEGISSVLGEKPAHEKDVTTLAAGAGTVLVGTALGRGIRLLADIVLAHLLGPLSFGLYATGWVLHRLLSLIGQLGLGQGVIRFGTQQWRRDESRFRGVIRQCLGLAACSGLMIGGGLYLAAPWLSHQVFQKPELTQVIRWFAFAIPLATVLQVATAATRITQRMKFTVYAEQLGQPTAQLLLIVFFFLLGRGLAGAVAAGVYSFGVALIITLHFLRQLFPELTSSHRGTPWQGKELLTFSLPASLAVMFMVFLTWSDRLIVAHFCTAAEAGVYYAASQLSVTFALILGCFGVIFAPMCADLHSRSETGRLEELYRVSTKWALYLSLPPFLVICFAPQQVMSLLFGGPYAAGWSALTILTVGQLVNAGTGPVGSLLVMIGYQRQWFVLSVIAFAINMALAFTLVPRWGMAGAAMGTASALVVLFSAAILFAKRAFGIWPYDRRILKGLLAAVVAGVVVLAIRELKIASPVLALCLMAFASAGVFGGTLFLVGFDREDREFVGMVRSRLGNHRLAIQE